jgi:hypothetical protein
MPSTLTVIRLSGLVKFVLAGVCGRGGLCETVRRRVRRTYQGVRLADVTRNRPAAGRG